KRHLTLGLLSESEAMRLPADLFAGLTVALAYLLGARAWSRRAGLVAAILSLAAPRMFFNAELACFDAPMATTWLLCVYCYWRALDDQRWGWRTGLALGLALATKHNGFFLPFVLGAHWIAVAVLRRRAGNPWPRIRPFVWMAILGPIIEIGHWPW